MSEVVLNEAFFTDHVTSTTHPELSALDRLDILDLTNRFEWCFDARRLDQLEQLFTDDVIIDHLFGYREGKGPAMDMMRSVVDSVGLRHQATNPSLFIDADGNVCVLSYLMVVQVVAQAPSLLPPPTLLAHAVVTDIVRKEGDQWKIARRTFEQMRVPDAYLPDPEARRHLEAAASQRTVERQQTNPA